jgi:hypothetical protein
MTNPPPTPPQTAPPASPAGRSGVATLPRDLADFLVELSEAWESPKIVAYIEERAGTEFEPEAALAFVRMLKRVETGIQLSPMGNGA